jgi:hypothetical protein
VTKIEQYGHRIGAGAGNVASGIAHWPSKAENGEKKAGRWIVLAGSGWLTEQLVARTHPLGLVAAGGFLIAAWVKGSVMRDVNDDILHQPTDEAAEDVAMVEFVLAVIGDRQGVHLVELLAAIQAHTDGWNECDKTYLRKVLTETVGLPVRKKMRVGDQTGIPGVHRDDAEAALTRLTTPPDVDEPTEPLPGDVDAGRSTRDPAA